MTLKLVLVSVLVVGVISLPSPNPQDDDYVDGYDGNDDDDASTTTAKTTKSTTVSSTTIKATTTAVSGKKVKFPYKISPVTGYKYTTVFGVHLFANSSLSDAKFQHTCGVLAAFLDNDQV